MSAVSHSIEANTATITLDDGKANVFGHELIADLGRALDEVEQEVGAVVIAGREGKLSGGFDLAVMQSGPDAARELVTAGAELFLRVFTFPRPVVVACTGHAVAAGAILLLAADMRIGAEGPFKIGLNELSIGMPLPIFAVELARQRLDPRRFPLAIGEAWLTDASEAVATGFLDRAVGPDDVVAGAVEHAQGLASRIDPAAFATTRGHLRAGITADITARMYDDLATFSLTK